MSNTHHHSLPIGSTTHHHSLPAGSTTQQESVPAGPSVHRVNRDLNAAITEGRKLTEWLFGDTRLTEEQRFDFHMNTTAWWRHNSGKWTDSTRTGHGDLVLK